MKANELIQHAMRAQKRAKAPYSSYPVGAAILTEDGSVILGCNIESKAYPTTLCAERVAIFSAIAQGHDKFKAMALITDDGAMPCGSCRQVMAEQIGDIPIYVADRTGGYTTITMEELLPHPFR
ncbi:MAG: cytidine deaminase [FCB group bacterium]|nr:cytidine deaminase [FCB group bacterium]